MSRTRQRWFRAALGLAAMLMAATGSAATVPQGTYYDQMGQGPTGTYFDLGGVPQGTYYDQ